MLVFPILLLSTVLTFYFKGQRAEHRTLQEGLLQVCLL